MADLEAVLADVSYLMAMEKSKCMPAARASKKIVLPDPRISPLVGVEFGGGGCGLDNKKKMATVEIAFKQ
uniref:Uncharacterized protein n=1 Tax=Anopheles dirus TaxID=7168 RepID=A0A182NPU1_9DIPT